MAEALAILGCAGAIFNVVDGISKIMNIITDLRARWEDADLTLLSLASQLTALRAASTKIQDWISHDLQDAHHQLVMDLEVSLSCCRVLVSKVENFFCDLSCLVEKPLDFRNKFKVVFGSAGPESVQKLIERQTSALTLLLTACNCKTLSDQQRHLETHKSRKVLNRAKEDSVSLCVQRDNASFTSKLTDNLSKISHVFDFDSHVFSTKVYERAFRGSVKNVLRQQQLNANPSAGLLHYSNVYLIGEDEIGKDLLVNAINARYPQKYTDNDWVLYRSQMQRLCLDLMCTIIKRGTPDWDMDYVTVLLAYSLGPHDERPTYTAALDACAKMWWSALRITHEPDPDPQGYLREMVEFHAMVFHIDIIPAGGLNIYCANSKARFFADQMDRVLPLRLVEPRFAPPLPADHLRARAALHPQRIYNFQFQIADVDLSLTGTSASDDTKWPAFQNLQNALAVAFVFDLQDYGSSVSEPFSELSARIESTLTVMNSLNNRGAPSEMTFVALYSNFKKFSDQLAQTPFLLKNGHSTCDSTIALAEIESYFRDTVILPYKSCVMDKNGISKSNGLLDILRNIGIQRNALPIVTEAENDSDYDTLYADP
ncbi:hypothetical protein BKA66DRAFT_567695 [Pyrenochaeta sp. MPI-SDFR-AT-0127]|nr:hypothetical protein BKA66DRAFT_567695 [Pyrenochaeta sp. MPI-SDFR-AT-0127]